MPRALHDTGKKSGFRLSGDSALRRYAGSEDIIGPWLGHAQRTVTDLYTVDYSKTSNGGANGASAWGLDSSLHGLVGLQNAVQNDSRKAA